MKRVLCHFGVQQKMLWRRPIAVVLNFLLPIMIFSTVVPGRGHPPEVEAYITVSFMAFSILGVMFHQFGSTLAEERHTSWAQYVSVLPVGNGELIAARMLSGACVAAVAPFALYVFARQTTAIRVTLAEAVVIIVVLIAGAIPFALMGVAIATHFRRSVAVSLAQFVYYPLVYAGGLWTPWNSLPDLVRRMSPFLPTRHLGELGWGVLRHRIEVGSIVVLAAYALVFGTVAVVGVRRQVERET